MELKALERFVGKDCTLTKTGSKRSGVVGVGQFEVGEMSLFTYPMTDKLPCRTAVMIQGNGFNFLRTSPVVKVVDETERTVVFETEGGVYRLELMEPTLG